MDNKENILLKIYKILEEEEADANTAIAIGMSIIKTAYRNMSENNPDGKLIEFADAISDKLNKSLKRSVFFPNEEISK